VPSLEAGRLDLALVQGEIAYEALTGIGRPRAALWILAAMYSTPGIFVVRAGSPCRSIDDLKGKPVAFGAAGSGLVILARYILDGLGLDRDRDFQALLLERAGDGPKLVMDGRAAALWGGGGAWPGFAAVAGGPAGARFIVPDAAGIRRILAKRAFLTPMTVPAGLYLGQDIPRTSVGSWSFILTRATLPEELAYRLASALHSCLRVVYRPHSERFSSPRPLSTWRTTNHETGATRLYQGHIVWLEPKNLTAKTAE
jgi:hypothetical protein